MALGIKWKRLVALGKSYAPFLSRIRFPRFDRHVQQWSVFLSVGFGYHRPGAVISSSNPGVVFLMHLNLKDPERPNGFPGDEDKKLPGTPPPVANRLSTNFRPLGIYNARQVTSPEFEPCAHSTRQTPRFAVPQGGVHRNRNYSLGRNPNWYAGGHLADGPIPNLFQ